MPFARVAVPAPLKPLDTLLDYRIPEELVGQVQIGSLVQVPFARRKTWALVFEISESTALAETQIKSIESLKLPMPVADRARLELFRWLSRHYLYPIGEVCESALPAAIREGTARTLKLPEKSFDEGSEIEASVPPPLNEDQASAIRQLATPSADPLLLWGVTGSGKTEVYLKAIEDRLHQGQSALLLVPEISLTPQLMSRFESRFPGEVATFHSALKPTAVRKAWLETLLGKRRIAIGARSALFAPVQNLGLIVLDEEHDGSYKQEDRLRYHARAVALEYGRIAKVPVLLGSATPSAESFDRVEKGLTRLARLPRRAVGEATLPEIQVLDLKKQIAQPNMDPRPKQPLTFQAPPIDGDFFLTAEMQRELQNVLDQGRQALLFLNRRGQASQLLCRGCGHKSNCPACEVTLTPHGKGLLCHYCGYEAPIPRECPACKRSDSPFLKVGIGTEALEEAVRLHFPTAKTLRLDRDTAETNDQLRDILGLFAEKKADILIGTQMVAKGHDFPDVTFVGIVLADIGLGVPDFRSNERALQLLLQVSGRAGRAIHPGRVLLQTFQPEHPVFQVLTRAQGLDDYGEFLRQEIENREALAYPPRGELALLRFDGLENDLVREAARKVAAGLNRIQSEGFRVLGPVPSPLARLRNRYRWQILLKSRNEEHLRKSLNWIMEGWDKQKLERTLKTRLIVDLEPATMM